MFVLVVVVGGELNRRILDTAVFLSGGHIDSSLSPSSKKRRLVDDGTCGGQDFHYAHPRQRPSKGN